MFITCEVVILKNLTWILFSLSWVRPCKNGRFILTSWKEKLKV